MLAASCTMAEMEVSEKETLPAKSEKVYLATIDDQPDEGATKTFTDETFKVRWNKDDRITIFPGSPDAVEARFTGEEGETGGGFKTLDYVGATDVFDGREYAVYPHRTSTEISSDEVISYTFPTLQTYRDHSFGRGDNPMVAKTKDGIFRFKNAGGYLVFKLYGEGVTVSSVMLKANGGEALAGPCTIDMSSGLPVVSMDEENATDELRLYCDKVELPSEGYKEFWFVLPPVSFSKDRGGFTITVKTTDGGIYTRSAAMDLSIERSMIHRMAPLKVTPVPGTDIPAINSLSSTRGSVVYTAKAQEGGDTYTLTIPTVTDFSSLPLNYEIEEGDILMVAGKELQDGAAVDASTPLSLVVCRGEVERTYTLEARNTGLPVLRITTEGFSREDIENDTEHETWRGFGAYKDNPALSADETASVRFELPDGTPGFVIKGTPSFEVATQIKGRGNATWKYPKRPYALKLDKKSEILVSGKMQGEEVVSMPAHKRWVLLANWKDRTLLRNDAAFWLSRHSGLPYTARGQYVELEFNGEHRGNYYLCEQIKIDPNRVAITEMDLGTDGQTVPEDYTGGYLMEIDNNFDEVNKFKSASFNLKYMFKDPDGDGAALPETVFNYMQDYINVLESKIRNAGNSDYKDYLDIDSAIWYMLVNEMTNNSDFYNTDGGQWSGPHSTYFYKDAGGKLFMGPVWDFDYHVFVPRYSNQWAGANQRNYYYNYLYQDSRFKDRMLELWNERKNTFQGLTDYIDTMAEHIRLSEEFDAEMWWTGTGDQRQNGEQSMTFDQAVANIKNGFTTKWTYIENNIANLSYRQY